MSGPTLSVGMPVFDGEAFIATAIESILNQTFRDFELIISDNGSTDRTQEIVGTYADTDHRIRYYRQAENLGAAANYNFVFTKATGRYFKWASHDDLIAPTMFERCLAAFESCPSDLILVYPRTTLLTSEDEQDRHYEDRLDLRQTSPHERLHHLVANVELCNAVYGIIRSDALRQTRLIAPFASSDEVLLAELALLGRFYEVPEYLFTRRLHDERSTVAHAAPEDRTAWFDPKATQRRYLHRTTVFVEDMRSILRSPVSVSERMQSLIALGRGYLPRWWRLMARELQHATSPKRG